MPRFHISADVVVDRPLEDVRTFFADVNSPVVWDRSVSKIVPQSPGPITVGSRFTTIGPSRGGREGKRSDYRIVAIDGDESTVVLENSPLFQSATWCMRLSPQADGTKIDCEMDMTTDWLHAPIGLMLVLNKKAVATDLVFLKRAIEHGEVAKR